VRNKVILTVSLALVILGTASMATADVPPQINYQGHLTDDSGAPLDTVISMTFTVYNDSSMGSLVLWTETQTGVEVGAGLFDVLLGSVTPIPDTVFASDWTWLGIQIGSDPEIAPRTKLVTVPYAFRVATVDGATGGTVEGDLEVMGEFRSRDKAAFGPWHNNSGSNTFVAGYSNDVTALGASVSGGANNQATETYATVSGGHGNQATGVESSIGGGFGHFASGSASTISGGYDNTASGTYSNVCGGDENEVVGARSTVLGGYRNYAGAIYSVALGGLYDTLTSNAQYSMAFGTAVYVDGLRRVVFFNGNTHGRLGLNRDDRDTISHIIHVGTDGSNGNGAHLTFGGTWTNGSSRTFKENFQSLDSQELLAKISGLPVQEWNYKGSDERHIGPVSEDFVQAFDVGTVRSDGIRDNKYLSPGDVAGVALAGVKELIQENQELKKAVEELKQQIADLNSAKASRGGK
jgi:hypothetical protein